MDRWAEGFGAHVLRFVCEARTPLRLGPYKGSALRGALFETLRGQFCLDAARRSCRECRLHPECAVSFLLAPVDDEGQRGHEPPRPYVIKPPLDWRTDYRPGETLEFRVVLFARALKLFPYLIVAVQRMGEEGLGAGRGRFSLREIWAENALAGKQERILQAGDSLVRVPDLAVTGEDIAERAALWQGAELGLRLRTPLRLVSAEQLVQQVRFGTLIRRLLERLTALWGAYGEQPLALDFGALLTRAEQVRVTEDRTKWLDLERYSGRQGRRLPMGGLIGEVRLGGDWRPFRELLAWAEVTHVGKYATLGNGWIEVGGSQGT